MILEKVPDVLRFAAQKTGLDKTRAYKHIDEQNKQFKARLESDRALRLRHYWTGTAIGVFFGAALSVLAAYMVVAAVRGGDREFLAVLVSPVFGAIAVDYWKVACDSIRELANG